MTSAARAPAESSAGATVWRAVEGRDLSSMSRDLSSMSGMPADISYRLLPV
ncbi:hypothetical protein [Streptomyces sp. NPDC001315]|uniref:hypothetical protein n=1 Tax=Streptomyces sp. NPDC001315 TaxID=3364562 RepID=UPI0036B95906